MASSVHRMLNLAKVMVVMRANIWTLRIIAAGSLCSADPNNLVRNEKICTRVVTDDYVDVKSLLFLTIFPQCPSLLLISNTTVVSSVEKFVWAADNLSS